MSMHIAKAPQTGDRLAELSVFEGRIGVSFFDKSLLLTALTHTSYANENAGCKNNERLEFLGDSVLGMITAEYLFESFKDEDEGKLSHVKAAVVSEASLSEVADRFGFSEFLLLGTGEEQCGGRNKKAILADAVEAVLAAIYLDQGFCEAKKFVLSFIPQQVEKTMAGKADYRDYKSQLQEYYQKIKGKVPEYLLDHTEGSQHEPLFFMKVFLGNRCFGPASGTNKKAAEQAVAKLALEALGQA